MRWNRDSVHASSWRPKKFAVSAPVPSTSTIDSTMPSPGMFGRSTDGISSRLEFSTLMNVLSTNSVTPSGSQTRRPARNHLRRTAPTFWFMRPASRGRGGLRLLLVLLFRLVLRRLRFRLALGLRRLGFRGLTLLDEVLLVARLEVGLVPPAARQAESGSGNGLHQPPLVADRALLRRRVGDLLQDLGLGTAGLAHVFVNRHGNILPHDRGDSGRYHPHFRRRHRQRGQRDLARRRWRGRRDPSRRRSRLAGRVPNARRL